MTFDKTAYQMYKSLESLHKFKGFTWSKADRHNYVFSNMIIQNCKAGRHGGAFYFEDMQRVLVKNTQIINNSAQKEGGGVQFACKPVIVNDQTLYKDGE